MVQRAATEQDIEVISSRRTFALLDWLEHREREVYPKEEGFMAGPLAPPPAPVVTPPIPLPEEVQGDAWSWATLPAGLLRDAADWPMSFSGLLPVPTNLEDEAQVPGLALIQSNPLPRNGGMAGGLRASPPAR